MTVLFDKLTTPRGFAALITAITVGTLGSAYIAQFFFDKDPCELCLYQRIPYAVIGLAGVYGLAMAGRRPVHLIALIAGLAFAAGAAVAFYHVGVEQTWWASALSCGAGLDFQQSQQDFLAALQKKPVKSCGDIDWTLFGISIATYNFVLSAAMAVFSFVAWPRLRAKG